MRPIRSRGACALAAAATVLLAVGCATHATAPAPETPNLLSEAPVANSPEAALLRLKWAWEHRQPGALRTLFTDDFVFAFGVSDSAGNAWREAPWGPVDERIASEHLFAGGGTEPPALSILLTFDPSLTVRPDTRPGHESTWHREITTSVALTVRTESRSYEVQGHGRFHFVRGDSAAIPPDLVLRGVQPDSTLWWIDRWEDETVPGPFLRSPLAINSSSWGGLKTLYR